MSALDLTDRAELLEVIRVLVDAMRRSDPEYTQPRDMAPCTDDDWDTAIQAGEDALEANEYFPEFTQNSAQLTLAAWDAHEVMRDALDTPEDADLKAIRKSLDTLGELLPAQRPADRESDAHV